ncbi:hypothetical protein CCP4SC76_5880003 [Gammaproteobacteria bacterium]
MDIKANGQDSLAVAENTPVTLTLSLDPGKLNGQWVDAWVKADTPFGTFYFSPEKSWQISAPYRFTEGGLTALSGLVILPDYPVPAGDYTITFAVDDNRDGAMNATWADSVRVVSRAAATGCKSEWHPGRFLLYGDIEYREAACPPGTFGTRQESHICTASGWTPTTTHNPSACGDIDGT